MKKPRLEKVTIPLPPKTVRELKRRAKVSSMGFRKIARLILIQAMTE
jgi:hypothetical protein